MKEHTNHYSRRQSIKTATAGLAGLASGATLSAAVNQPSLLTNHHAKAKRIIVLFMAGGPSQFELFDPKPYIEKMHGKLVKPPVNNKLHRNGVDKGFIAFGSKEAVRPRGESGLPMSDLLPHMASVADELCLLKAMQADSKNHSSAVLQMNTGLSIETRPSLGAWLNYGLGSENKNLPGFVTIHPDSDIRNYGAGFLPSSHQGTPLRVGKANEPLIDYLESNNKHSQLSKARLAFLQEQNQSFLNQFQKDPQMEGMIDAINLANRMQAAAPDVVDFSKESKATKSMYGIGEKHTDKNGKACLLARRLIESGVRCVQVTMKGWDHHSDIRSNLPKSCKEMDKPVAALIKDLKSRGLLDETLIVWTGEFGRSPWSQDLSGKTPLEKHGREHQQESFCSLMVGGGIQGGLVYGKTDDFGFLPVEGKVHVHDLHATILHQMGIHHEKLVYRKQGRDYRLTDVFGHVVHEIIS